MEKVQTPQKRSSVESLLSLMDQSQAGSSDAARSARRQGGAMQLTASDDLQQPHCPDGSATGSSSVTQATSMPAIVTSQYEHDHHHAQACSTSCNHQQQQSHQQPQATASRMRLPTAAERRRVRELATMLLTLTICQECSRPVQEPIALPCGHATCLQCVKDRCVPRSVPAEEDVSALPCMTHLPPRLPLSPITVPCPVNGCPRSAIGRGLGAWSGHRPRYGLIPSYTERLPVGEEDVGPGVPPVDGFVIGVADHPYRLTVIGPQSRFKAHLFAVPPMGVEPIAIGNTKTNASLLPSLATSNLLRPDVTLSKALALLKRYASSPVPHPSRSRRSTFQAALRSRGSNRQFGSRRGDYVATGRGRPGSRFSTYRGRGVSNSSQSSSVSCSATMLAGFSTTTRPTAPHRRADEGRGQLSRSAMVALGTNESDLESGTVGVVQAAAPDMEDEYDFYGYKQQEGEASGLAAGIFADAQDGEDEDNGNLWPDGVGGAFARPLSGNSMALDARLKRRHAARAAPTAARLQRVQDEASLDHRHADSGWSTDDSIQTDGVTRPLDALDGSSERPGSRLGRSSPRRGARAEEEKAASLSLSSKVGPGGEPLVQTITTLHSELLEVLECQLCYLLLYQPLTTPCGHTFCKPCFSRSLDHGNKCPLCRAEMPSFAFFQEHPSNVAVLKILTADTAFLTDEDSSEEGTPSPRTRMQKQDDFDSAPHHFGFKALYENRKTAIEQEEREARLSTPIFVCTLAFPSMPTILHIFEPRYRLMVRRCLESGNPRFGMVLPSKTNDGLEEYGTMLEIKSVQMLADGRSMLETVGSYRFKLLEKGSLDGYTVGRIERLDDISLEEEAELERAAMVRREELDRKKAEEQLLSRAPTTEDGDPEQQQDPLQLYRSDDVDDGHLQRTSSTDSEHDLTLMPFAPLPAEPCTAELVEICTSFIETLRSGSAPWLLSRLNHTYGPMPEAHQVGGLGYWMALVMPIDEHEKAKLLPITSRRLRLCLVVHWIEQLRQSWWFNSGCTVS